MTKEDIGLRETHRYDDIIHLPHHVSDHRMPMSASDRAAQFSPFAALVGYDRVIDETARLTEPEAELTEEEQARLSRQLARLRERLSSSPEAAFTVFIPDGKKDGGGYETLRGRVKGIDALRQLILLEDGRAIPFSSLHAIEEDAEASPQSE